MPQFTWDRGVDFGATRTKLIQMLQDLRPQAEESPNSIIRIFHCSILLVQLINGARISEAFDAAINWVNNSKREQEIRVRKRRARCVCLHVKINDRGNSSGHELVSKGKRGKCKVPGCVCKEYRPDVTDIETRLMTIPPELTEQDRAIADAAIEYGVTINATKLFALKVLHFNTHSLRYAQITELARQGKPPQLIAKITHHKGLDFILKYTQQKEADNTLRELTG